ncbi:aromatic amino acid transaminase [Celeribacter halophilus]|jgi:aromatic-amino-acid transaminase|uniref:Amino acid aminotransferase n=1 Tax=Celeribacter halophilus TaxID=576117 RepID=A0AAW7XU08_9RHOB|nr:amino acid aminotransferase [Celeribacter halophilus]MBU2890000.1 aspartate/tyrosine/aromatic aminotransferase [Celeribacter halophilus]MDO6457784.1 amino acid aminotransferase [Celeribacter halophilus]MDO6511387.1 amino acid aminotransferase [Celeribacter halophilus]MDO6724042.1 amino acid aminotransferase [Celeribacter halophilus]
MLSTLKPQPADKILELMALYRDDPRDTKIDLGVGIYKNADGETPVMRAVKAAEKQLWEVETTKKYTALSGDPAYGDAMKSLVLADSVDHARVGAIATPGGTGAIRQAFELAKLANPDVTVWTSNPTWPNHVSIIKFMGLKNESYAYFDEASCTVDFDAMMESLKGVKAGDLVLLHGCCHNPTGANLTLEQYGLVADLIIEKGATALVDIAYQGFGDGLEEDAAATRLLASKLPELLVAASCSKNFGIYRERTGCLMAMSETAEQTPVTQGTLNFLNRQNYSFPPDHGARLVTMILNDDALKADWMAELEDVRLGMLGLRQQLADELKRLTNSDRFDFIAGHRGMFSRIGATPEEVMKIREEFGIYMVGDSRMNIAGLNSTTVPLLAEAVAKTCK